MLSKICTLFQPIKFQIFRILTISNDNTLSKEAKQKHQDQACKARKKALFFQTIQILGTQKRKSSPRELLHVKSKGLDHCVYGLSISLLEIFSSVDGARILKNTCCNHYIINISCSIYALLLLFQVSFVLWPP